MDTAFRRLLANTLVTGVTNTFLWFALAFWIFLETRSVVATGAIGGAFAAPVSAIEVTPARCEGITADRVVNAAA
jgi:DHA3 family multidrug efflux protein-like MFS transporter